MSSWPRCLRVGVVTVVLVGGLSPAARANQAHVARHYCGYAWSYPNANATYRHGDNVFVDRGAVSCRTALRVVRRYTKTRAGGQGCMSKACLISVSGYSCVTPPFASGIDAQCRSGTKLITAITITSTD